MVTPNTALTYQSLAPPMMYGGASCSHKGSNRLDRCPKPTSVLLSPRSRLSWRRRTTTMTTVAQGDDETLYVHLCNGASKSTRSSMGFSSQAGWGPYEDWKEGRKEHPMARHLLGCSVSGEQIRNEDWNICHSLSCKFLWPDTFGSPLKSMQNSPFWWLG